MRLGVGLTVNFFKRPIGCPPSIRKSFRVLDMDYLQQLYSRIMGFDVESYVTISHKNDNLPHKVVAFGNVLLDQTARLNDTKLFERYNLSLNTRAELDIDTLLKITTEVTDNNESQGPHLGGSALNTSRILKRLGIEPMYFGAVGDDKHAEVVENLLKKDGMEVNNYRLQRVPSTPTGRCICLLHKDSVACYANISASSKFSEAYLKKIEEEENAFFLRNSGQKQIIYIEGFFVPQREDVVTYIVRSYVMGRRRLALNLSADYIVRKNYYHMLYLANEAYFIFGNEEEFEALRDCWGAKSIDDFGEQLIKQSKNVKIIVITRGADFVSLITNYQDELSPPGELLFENFNVPRVKEVVDPTGCGDTFVAAFLFAWLEKRSLSECIRNAIDVSGKVITQIGCNLPEDTIKVPSST